MKNLGCNVELAVVPKEIEVNNFKPFEGFSFAGSIQLEVSKKKTLTEINKKVSEYIKKTFIGEKEFYSVLVAIQEIENDFLCTLRILVK